MISAECKLLVICLFWGSCGVSWPWKVNQFSPLKRMTQLNYVVQMEWSCFHWNAAAKYFTPTFGLTFSIRSENKNCSDIFVDLEMMVCLKMHVSWCTEPSQPQRIKSGETNFISQLFNPWVTKPQVSLKCVSQFYCLIHWQYSECSFYYLCRKQARTPSKTHQVSCEWFRLWQ